MERETGGDGGNGLETPRHTTGTLGSSDVPDRIKLRMCFRLLGTAAAKASWLELRETQNGVLVMLDSLFDKPGLTPGEARGLAKELYRLARRIERRQPKEVTGFFAMLTDEQRAAALAYDGPEPTIGSEEFRRDQFAPAPNPQAPSLVEGGDEARPQGQAQPQAPERPDGQRVHEAAGLAERGS